jgi:hypothetical protein
MWIATKIGFFSIVLRPEREGAKEHVFHIRARAGADIDAIISLLEPVLKRPLRLFETPDADYHWRIILRPGELAPALAALAATVDYPNFKDEIHSSDTQADKLDAYSDLWSALYEIQSRES